MPQINTRKGAERHPEKQKYPDRPQPRRPDWLRVKAPVSKAYNETRKSLENDDEDNAGLLNQLRKIDDQSTMQGLKKTKETKVTKK